MEQDLLNLREGRCVTDYVRNIASYVCVYYCFDRLLEHILLIVAAKQVRNISKNK